MSQNEHINRAEFKLDEKRYRELLIYLPEGVGITDLDENLLFVNDEFAEMLGYEYHELIGKNIYELIPARERTLLEKESAKRVVGVSSAYTLTMIRKDGGEIIAKVSGVPRRDDEDNVIGTMAVVMDITTEREHELELLKLSRAIEASSTSVVITDIDATIEYVNPKFSELTGYSSEEALGANPRILKSDRTPLKTYEDLWDTLTAGKVWHGRFVNRKKTGELYWEEASISPVFDADGKTTHYVAVKEDITRSVVAEEKLYFSNQDLELYTSFLQHDLRNDLQVLMNHAEAAHMLVEDGSRVSDYISVVEAASERMVHLLDIFGRPAQIDEVDIVGILEKCKSQAEKTHSNLTVMIDVKTDNTEVLSARLIPIVFDNLMRNSAEYAENDVTLSIKITGEDDVVCIFLTDDGPGISKEIESRLFEKGVSTTGGGLGLYLTRKVIEGYNGTIEYLSNKNESGTTFRITLPSKPS
jgi:PAS domain S-box-containing protein